MTLQLKPWNITKPKANPTHEKSAKEMVKITKKTRKERAFLPWVLFINRQFWRFG